MSPGTIRLLPYDCARTVGSNTAFRQSLTSKSLNNSANVLPSLSADTRTNPDGAGRKVLYDTMCLGETPTQFETIVRQSRPQE